MPEFDPISNDRTSQVFIQMLKGKENPKAIANALGIQSPSIIQHLWRLRKIELVQLGSKEGRRQNYEVDFDKFLTLFINRALQEKFTHPDYLHEDQIIELKSLKDNLYFRRFIVTYLKNIDSKTTIADSINVFESALLHSDWLKHKKKKYDSMEKQEFFNKMCLWREVAEDKMTRTQLDLLDALTRTLDEDVT